MKQTVTPYEVVVSRFGGVRRLATALGFGSHTTVTRWKDRGLIPAQHQLHVLTKARELGIRLTAEELITGAVSIESAPNEPTKNSRKIAA